MIDGKTYLYRHFDANGDLLYVGVTIHPKTRLLTHKKNSPWGKYISKVKEIEYVGFCGYEKCLTDEAFAIVIERPIHNKRFNRNRVINEMKVKVVSDLRQGARSKRYTEAIRPELAQ